MLEESRPSGLYSSPTKKLEYGFSLKPLQEIPLMRPFNSLCGFENSLFAGVGNSFKNLQRIKAFSLPGGSGSG